MRPELEAHAAPFLEALTGCPAGDGSLQSVTFQTFTDPLPKPDPDPLACIRFGSLKARAQELERMNDQGAGIFVAVNVTKGGRKKENVRAIRGWHADLDFKDATAPFDLGCLPLAPTIAVRTPGGVHLYWLTLDPMPCPGEARWKEHEAELRAIRAALTDYGADKRACDVTRVLRVPGYLHRKAAPRLVELVTASGPRYTREQIRAAFPPQGANPQESPTPILCPVDRAEVLRRAEAYLATLPGGFQGDDGSGATFQAALKVATRFALSEAETLDVLTRIHNPKCKPAWSAGELRHKAGDAWASAQKSPDLGCAFREAQGENLTKPDTPAHAGRPHVRGFEWGDRGLFQVTDDGKDSDGNPKPPKRTWIAPPFELPGLVRDTESGDWRLLIAWDDLDGVPHEEAVPFDQLSGEGAELARSLGRGGMVLPPDTGLRKALLRYLSAARPKLKRRVRLVEALGWHDGAFVLPDGTTIGQAREPLRFAGEASALHRRATGGTLEGWKAQVAAHAVGEPRLAFGLACAFAGPLLALVRPDGGGGFNLQGFSSKGKSTILVCAASVWHCPEHLTTWRATSNGLEGIAAARNDGFLVLDEMSQVPDAKELGATAYMLANGTAKVRANRDGGNRPLKTWRTIFLSSGEVGLEDKLGEDGKRTMAGQEVRVPDIPCPPSGMLEDSHGFPNLGAFAEHLKRASHEHYGHAARAFLARLSEEWARRDALQAKLREMEAAWMTATIPAGADAQVRRVGGRFALVAVAGELAQRMGILPWPEGEAERAAAVCFRAWLDRRGHAGASEVHRGIAAVLAFLERHGQARFDEWGSAGKQGEEEGRAPRTINRAGTRKRAEGPVDGWDFYLTTDGWKEACLGSSPREVARACADAGILEPGGEGKLSQSVKIPGHGKVRCYVIRAVSLINHLEQEAA